MINDTSKNVEKYRDNPLSGNHFFSVAKKTEKIVTAIYMVTSFMEGTDPLQREIRRQAVALLRDVFSCLEAPVSYRAETLSRNLVGVESLISLFEVGVQLGLVSKMNERIIRNELLHLQNALHGELHIHRTLDGHHEPHTHIEQQEFLTNLLKDKEQPKNDTQNDIKKDIKTSFSKNVVNKTSSTDKQDKAKMRRDRILAIIKDKKSVTMKDLATRITNCTEKTLQRDVARLIDEGYIKKEGSKRWSTYVVI